MSVLTASAVRICEGCDDHMGNGWWWAMGIGWLIFLAVVVVLAVVLVRQYRPGPGPRRSAHETLDERFARGEIDEAEYRARLETLRR